MQEYLKKNSVNSKEDLDVFLKSLHGNLTVGFIKLANNLECMSVFLSMYNVDSFGDLQVLLRYSSLEKKCPCCDNLIRADKKTCSRACSQVLRFRDPNERERMSILQLKQWENFTDEHRKEMIHARKKGFIDKYGVDHNWKIEKVKEDRKKTWLEKYGFENPNKNEKQKQKLRDNLKQNHNLYFKFKSLKLPSGKIVKYQGYEDIVIMYHLQYVSESALHTENLSFDYYDTNLKRNRLYLPDFQIGETVFEVKSTFTVRQILNIRDKAIGVVNSGKSFKLILVQNDKEEMLTCKTNELLSLKENDYKKINWFKYEIDENTLN